MVKNIVLRSNWLVSLEYNAFIILFLIAKHLKKNGPLKIVWQSLRIDKYKINKSIRKISWGKDF